MCGILAHIKRDDVIDLAVFNAMRDTMTQRGPDGFGTRLLHDGRVALGHRRLSIIDLSEDGRQPMCNEDGKVWITFNGEIYNFHKLRKELLSCGHFFGSKTDTEVLIHGYEEWGIEGLLQRLKGMFAFVIWDDRTKKVHAVRDRFGIKPLIYYHDGKQIVFASELKAIAANPAFPKDIDENGLADFFIYSYVPYTGTIYKNTHTLAPSHFLTLDYETFQLTVTRYWELGMDTLEVNECEAIEKTNDLIRQATNEHLIADVPVGLFLSGGYDSATLLMHMSDLGYKPSCYTIGFESSERSEHDQASALAETFGANHHLEMISPGTDVFSLLGKMSYYYDQPFAASSMVNSHIISEMAARNCKVVLSGEGADEVFGGYKWHQKIAGYYKNFALKERVKNLLNGLFTKKDIYLNLYNRSMTGVLKETMQKDVLDGDIKSLMRDRGLWHFEQFYRPGTDVVKQCQLIDTFTFIPNHCLYRADISSMAHSLEVRVPFMDHEIYSYVFSLNRNMYFKEGRKKFLIEENIKARVPREVLEMPKRGFSFQGLDNAFDDRFYELIRNGELMKRGLLNRNVQLEKLSAIYKFHLTNLEMWFKNHHTA